MDRRLRRFPVYASMRRSAALFLGQLIVTGVGNVVPVIDQALQDAAASRLDASAIAHRVFLADCKTTMVLHALLQRVVTDVGNFLLMVEQASPRLRSTAAVAFGIGTAGRIGCLRIGKHLQQAEPKAGNVTHGCRLRIQNRGGVRTSRDGFTMAD